MDTGRTLRGARRRAGLTQRGLASATGIAQPTIARIESGATVPRVDTLERLLEAAGQSLQVQTRMGVGVDRTLIAELLALSPRVRISSLSDEAGFLDRLDAARDIQERR